MVRVLLKGLTKRFGNFLAVNNLNLEVDDGKFVAFLGPSGCGKTTTLRMIAGLDSPTSGAIYFDNELVNDVPTEKRDIAMVFQFYAIYPDKTVAENIAFPLRMQKVPLDEIGKRVKDTAKRVGIEDMLTQRENVLTVGQKQRVALARAIVRNPKIFLFDEPLTNLDARTRAVMRAEIRRLHVGLKKTAVYVTHDQLEAMSMADKIAVMNQGQLMQYDTPDMLFSKPANLFVAGFVGTPPMSFLEGTYVLQGEKARLDFGEFTLDATELKAFFRERDKSEIIAGLRPSDLMIGQGHKHMKNITAHVDIVEDFGDRSILHLKIGAHMLKAEVPEGFVAKAGDKVDLAFDVRRLHIFDKSTSQAIV